MKSLLNSLCSALHSGWRKSTPKKDCLKTHFNLEALESRLVPAGGGNTNTITTLVTDPNSQSTLGSTYEADVTVQTTSGAAVPSGTVNITDNGTQIGSVALSSSGTAVFASSSLPAGSNSLVGTFTGITGYNSSVSSALLLC